MLRNNSWHVGLVYRYYCCYNCQSSSSSTLLSTVSLSSSKQHHFVGRCSHMSNPIRIAVVGDIHNDWSLQEDSKALKLLRPDLVLFTGDFGNENVELVKSIASLDFTKAAILGNHDAWSTQQFSKRKKDGVQLQLECLGGEHVGYQRLDCPALKLSIVGGRPFSCGGERLFRKRLLESRYGIDDMDGSANRICQAALGAPEDHSVIFLAHNGPTGLGSNIDDICGRDWFSEGGDHGDPDCYVIMLDTSTMYLLICQFVNTGVILDSLYTDLAQAISKLKETTKLSIPLVVFGHMHKELACGNGLRKMVVVGDDNTTYLNGAIVPRTKTVKYQIATGQETQGTLRAFTLIEISHGKLDKIAETWVSVFDEETNLEQELILYCRENSGNHTKELSV